MKNEEQRKPADTPNPMKTTRVLIKMRGMTVLLFGLTAMSTSAAERGATPGSGTTSAPAPRVAKVDPKVYDAYVGQYQLEPDMLLWFWRDKDRLMSQATGQGKVEVFPRTETEFFLKEVDAQITFVKGKDGKVTHLVLHQNGDHQAKKISDVPPKERRAVKVDPKMYAGYVGDYEVQPGLIISVTKETDRLMAQATGQQKFEIFPESETNFFYQVVDAQVSFKKDARGKVTGLVLHQRGDHEAKKIK
jgi:hypothetical protein